MLKSRKSVAVAVGPARTDRAFCAAFLISMLVFVAGAPEAKAATIDLTGDDWDVEGFDDFGNIWDGSTLVFETQILNANGEDYDLTGYFDWAGAGPLCPAGCSGREFFTGTLFGNLSLDLSGVALNDPVGIILGAYSALALDELNIVNGVWAGLNQPGVPGEWMASRAGAPSEVPLPAAAPMFASALAGFFGWGATRRRVRSSRAG